MAAASTTSPKPFSLMSIAMLDWKAKLNSDTAKKTKQAYTSVGREQLPQSFRPMPATHQTVLQRAFRQLARRDHQHGHHAHIDEVREVPLGQGQKAHQKRHHGGTQIVQGLLEAEHAAAFALVVPILAHQHARQGMQKPLPHADEGAAGEQQADVRLRNGHRHQPADQQEHERHLGNGLLVHVRGQKSRQQGGGNAGERRKGEHHLDARTRNVRIHLPQNGQHRRKRREHAVVDGEGANGNQQKQMLDAKVTRYAAEETFRP